MEQKIKTTPKKPKQLALYKVQIKLVNKKNKVSHYLDNKSYIIEQAKLVAKKLIKELNKNNEFISLKPKYIECGSTSMSKKEKNRIILMNDTRPDEIFEPKWNIFRKEKKYSIEDVLSQYNSDDSLVDFDGDMIPMGSHRYANFKFHGITCECCGITGKYFLKGRFIRNKIYHFNLYAIDKNGKEVLMTKDHILPRASKGRDIIDNYQTLCEKCNSLKGSMDNDEFIAKYKK